MFVGDEQSIDVSRAISMKLANGTNKNMNVNGSVTPVIFEAKPPQGKKVANYKNGWIFRGC